MAVMVGGSVKRRDEALEAAGPVLDSLCIGAWGGGWAPDVHIGPRQPSQEHETDR